MKTILVAVMVSAANAPIKVQKCNREAAGNADKQRLSAILKEKYWPIGILVYRFMVEDNKRVQTTRQRDSRVPAAEQIPTFIISVISKKQCWIMH